MNYPPTRWLSVNGWQFAEVRCLSEGKGCTLIRDIGGAQEGKLSLPKRSRLITVTGRLIENVRDGSCNSHPRAASDFE